jgi:hypothetical protein
MKNRAQLWGTCESINAVVAVPKCELSPLLTKDLDFTPQDFTPEGYHPVIFQANTQHIHVFFKWLKMTYYEMIPLISYIHFKDNPSVSYQSAPILYVSRWSIVFGARILWHLNKVVGKFSLSAPVADFPKVKYISEKVFRKNVLAITMDSKAVGEPGKPEDFPNFQKISTLFMRDALIYNDLLQYWKAKYEVQVSSIQAAESVIDVNNVPGMKAAQYRSPSITESVLGAFQINFSWQLWEPEQVNP